MFKCDRANTGMGDESALRYAVSWLAWPFLFITCMSVTAYGFSYGDGLMPLLCFNGAYVFLIVSLLCLERVMPHEAKWRKSDGQIFADIAHTLTSKGTSQVIILVNGYIGASMMTGGDSGLLGVQIWPSDWPMYVQVILAVYVSEFMLYWAHRTAHEFMPIWRFHAVHHSVGKLWIVNTGRFHFIDALYSIVLGIIPLVIMGASMDVVMWLAAVTAFIGMLTHCNVEMRFGPLSWIFNTPELHRWHHSKRLREGNMNYGENVVIWDMIFGTYFREDRRPPSNIGITTYMPDKFREQLVFPFLSARRRQEISDAAGFVSKVKKKTVGAESKPKKEDKADFIQAAE